MELWIYVIGMLGWCVYIYYKDWKGNKDHQEWKDDFRKQVELSKKEDAEFWKVIGLQKGK